MSALPPGPGDPGVVQLARYVTAPMDLLTRCAARFGDTFTLRLAGSGPLVVFSHPDALRELFTASTDDLHAGEGNALMEGLVGRRSVFLLDGAAHRRARRLLLPPLHGDRMTAYGPTIAAITDAAVARWPRGRAFPVLREMRAITLDVVLRTVFGVEEAPSLVRLREALTTLMDGDTVLREQIVRRREGGTAGRTDVLSLLVDARDEAGAPMTTEELRDQMVTLLAAGHETSATTLAWVFHWLTARPDILARVRAELGVDAGGGALAPDRVASLPYLDAVLRETLRVNPVIVVALRKVRRSMTVGGVGLPAGVGVAAAIPLTHQRADVWRDPEVFRPERFLERKYSPYEFVPFGGGARRCVGMAFAMYEMKVVLARVIHGCTFRAAASKPVRPVRSGVALAPSEGMPLVVA